jgi:hypothetical protein
MAGSPFMAARLPSLARRSQPCCLGLTQGGNDPFFFEEFEEEWQ